MSSHATSFALRYTGNGSALLGHVGDTPLDPGKGKAKGGTRKAAPKRSQQQPKINGLNHDQFEGFANIPGEEHPPKSEYFRARFGYPESEPVGRTPWDGFDEHYMSGAFNSSGAPV